MTKEELLKPRFKVISDYPNSGHTVGEVLQGRGVELYENHFLQYPHIFRKLEWHEERKIEDMPKYVTHLNKIVKVTEWRFSYGEWLYTFFTQFKIRDCKVKWASPATEQEFKNYKSPKPSEVK